MSGRASRCKPVKRPGREIELIRINDIEVREGRRGINDAAVERLAESMRTIGLKVPISVRHYMERPDHLPGSSIDAIVLLAGAHRLEAAKRLGWEQIECFTYMIHDAYEHTMDDLEAELWEIAENLHRAELTTLERDEHVARWIQLVEDKEQVSDKLSETPRGGRPGAAAAASRELGINERDVQRAVQVASLSPDAKQAARDIGLDNNRAVLLNAAKQEGSEAQVHCLQAEAQKRKKQPKTYLERIDVEFSRMIKAWDAGCTQSRKKFYKHILGSREFNFVKLGCPVESDEDDAKPAEAG